MKDQTKENIKSKTFGAATASANSAGPICTENLTASANSCDTGPIATAASSSVSSFATYKNPYEKFSEENALKEGEIIKCPHCGKSYYSMGFTTSTCIGYNRVFKDGVEITKDPNYHTTQCYCLECNKSFLITIHEGKTYVQ